MTRRIPLVALGALLAAVVAAGPARAQSSTPLALAVDASAATLVYPKWPDLLAAIARPRTPER